MVQPSEALSRSQVERKVVSRRTMSGRLVRSVSALGFAQIFNIASNLILVPLYLSFWKAERYGEWIALSALVAYLSTADFGMNSAASNALLTAYSRKDYSKYRSLQASSMAFYIAVAAAVTLAVSVICISCPTAEWLGVSHIERGTAAAVVWLLAVRLMWSMQIGRAHV